MNDKMIAKGIDKAIALLSGEGHDTLGESEELRTRAVLLLIDLADELDPPQTRREKAGLPEPTVVPKAEPKIKAGQIWEDSRETRRRVLTVSPIGRVSYTRKARGEEDWSPRSNPTYWFLSFAGKVVDHVS